MGHQHNCVNVGCVFHQVLYEGNLCRLLVAPHTPVVDTAAHQVQSNKQDTLSDEMKDFRQSIRPLYAHATASWPELMETLEFINPVIPGLIGVGTIVPFVV